MSALTISYTFNSSAITTATFPKFLVAKYKFSASPADTNNTLPVNFNVSNNLIASFVLTLSRTS